MELGAEAALAARHLAGVGCVVVAGEVQQAVQDEDFELCAKEVAVLSGLAAGGWNADGEVAGDFFLVLDESCERE